MGWKIKCNFIKSIKSKIESHFTVREEIKGSEPLHSTEVGDLTEGGDNGFEEVGDQRRVNPAH